MNLILLHGTVNLLLYFIIAVGIAFPARFFFTIQDEIFRKILHFILLGSFWVFVISFPNWYSTALAAIIFELAVYPILILFERVKNYSQFTTERTHGELKQSLLLVYTMFAIVIFICWGIFKDQYLALTSLYAWGFGDAAAALIGKRYGKHKIRGYRLDGKKSYEGSLAMFLVSCISIFILLTIRGSLSVIPCIIISLIVGSICTLVELYSKNGNDTVFCPLAAMIALLCLVHLFGGM